MKTIILSIVLLTSVYADVINTKTLACPSLDVLKKAPLAQQASPMGLTMYAIANGCEVLTKNEKVETIGYDPRNSKELFQQILYKKNGVQLYVKSSAITVEQGGKKNSMRF